MKKFYFLLLSVFVFIHSSIAQQQPGDPEIQDSAFAKFLVKKYPGCIVYSPESQDSTYPYLMHPAGYDIISNCSAVKTADSMDIHGLGIMSLAGLEYFTSLKWLNCSSNGINFAPFPSSLKYLDISSALYSDGPFVDMLPLPDSLTYLDCSGNSMLRMSTLPATLQYLFCENDGLYGLPSLPNSLIYLDCTSQYDITITSGPRSLGQLPTLPSGLRYLYCGSNTLNSFPPLPASLRHLDCTDQGNFDINGNYIPTLYTIPTLPDSLVYLNCSNVTSIANLPALPASLDTLFCVGNVITSLPNLSSLTYLNCSSNQISNLPALPNTMNKLICESNLLKGLPSLPGSLTYLDCSSNIITDLGPRLTASLRFLDCSNNQLNSLPAIPDSLSYLDCSTNAISSLPILPNPLTDLTCSYNNLTQLPTLPGKLSYLDCSNNYISCLPELPPSMGTVSPWRLNSDHSKHYHQELYNLYIINVDYPYTPNQLCLPNIIKGIRPGIFGVNGYGSGVANAFNGLPLCNPVNNKNHCHPHPVVYGNIFYDNNSNGTRDTGEYYKPNVRVQLDDSLYTFSNSNGYYEITTDSTGSYTLSVNTPVYYKAVPSSVNYNFTSFDTSVHQDIALQPTQNVDSLSIHIIPLTWRARPGSSFIYLVSFANVGTTTLLPTVSFNYDTRYLVNPYSTNSSLTYSLGRLGLQENNFYPGQRDSFIVNFDVKSTAAFNSTIFGNVMIKANNVVATDSVVSTISSSFDPNDKQATPLLTSQDVTKGKSIQYIIRFQNTGNDTAFNIVVADTLNSLLDAGKVEVLASSNPCKVTVNGNIVFFEFLNINLPDSNVNKVGSHGFVEFAIKPLSFVNNDTIQNNASIYFDYNAAIITNTATTLMQDTAGTVPLRLIGFNGFVQPGTDNVLLLWNTANEINVRSFLIEQSTDGINFTELANVSPKGSGSNSYSHLSTINVSVMFYRLKTIDINGSFRYSSVVKVSSIALPDISILNNPSKGRLIIRTDASSLNNTSANLINGQGAIVNRFMLHTGIQNINVTSLPAGVYYIQTQRSSLRFVLIK